MTEDQIASIQYAADWLSRSEDIGNRKHGERLRALLSASIADTAGAIDKKAIAWDAHQTCARIPGATHYNAAEIAIDAVLKAIAATPASSVADAAAKFTERERFVWNLGYSAGTDRAAHVAQKCMHGKTYEEHGRTNWNNGIAEAVDAIRALAPEAGSNSVADAAGASDIRTLIADDAYAMSFQTLGQYRSALLKAIAKESGDD